jgi:hypothetical protein
MTSNLALANPLTFPPPFLFAPTGYADRLTVVILKEVMPRPTLATGDLFVGMNQQLAVYIMHFVVFHGFLTSNFFHTFLANLFMAFLRALRRLA